MAPAELWIYKCKLVLCHAACLSGDLHSVHIPRVCCTASSRLHGHMLSAWLYTSTACASAARMSVLAPNSQCMLCHIMQGCPQFSHLCLTGGAIGSGPPMAVGAAVACPDKRVINLQADGSAMYSLQVGMCPRGRQGVFCLLNVWMCASSSGAFVASGRLHHCCFQCPIQSK